MRYKKAGDRLALISALTALFSSCLGLFYTHGGTMRAVKNIYGHKVMLFGDGIYQHDSILRASIAKGTDIVIILLALLIMYTLFKKSKAFVYLRAGFLFSLFYASTCVVMGVHFNRLFLLYVLQFSSALFAFYFTYLHIKSHYSIRKTHKKRTAWFLIIFSFSVMIWLNYIIPSMLYGTPMALIETYTTEPTFAMDIGLILPLSILTGMSLLKRQDFGYHFTPIILTFISCIGLVVITQTAIQIYMGIILSPGEYMGLVVSFVVIGAVSLILNYKMLKYTI